MEKEKKRKLQRINCWVLLKDGNKYRASYHDKTQFVEMDDEEFIKFAQNSLFNSIIDAKILRFEDDMYAKDQLVKAYFTYEYEE